MSTDDGMKCFICSSDFRINRTFTLVILGKEKFWFCNSHIPKKKTLQHLSDAEVLSKLVKQKERFRRPKVFHLPSVGGINPTSRWRSWSRLSANWASCGVTEKDEKVVGEKVGVFRNKRALSNPEWTTEREEKSNPVLKDGKSGSYLFSKKVPGKTGNFVCFSLFFWFWISLGARSK